MITYAQMKNNAEVRKKNVLILLWSSTIASGRDFLAGFTRRARHRRDWRLPAAVMAACDTTALEVMEACKRARISVPNQISVLGVDNDELMCEFDSPTISSVLPRHEGRCGLGHCSTRR